MKVKFNQKYKSIINFNETDIKDFSIFLGVNGSGKTHLLKAMQEGFVFADSIPKEKISYFNLQTFLIKNQQNVAPRNLDDEKLQAWNILNSQKQIFQNYDDQIKTIVTEKKYPYDAKVSEAQKEQYAQQKKSIIKFINDQTQNNPKIKKLLKTGIFESDKYASEITQVEFFKFANYNPDDYELLESLSEVFLDYQKKLTVAKLFKKDGGEGLKGDKIKKLQEQSPWNFVNNMFVEFGLPHTITHPKFNAGDLINSQAVLFQVKLHIDNEEIDFDDLSSGEKILCALAITVYQDNKSKFPELLLLDEIDASLHPSMIQHLLDVIENVFIKNRCKVILATHSPTTVALASEKSLFEVQKGKELKKINKISQADAINLLSEGIITFEKGLKIQKNIDGTKKLQIITEGNNTEHIKKAIQILDNNLLDQIKIIEGSPDKRGQQLKNAFDVMSSGDYTGKFLFVWDCDTTSKIEDIDETDSFKKFCFMENSTNTKAKDKDGKAVGIENLYPDSLFTDDVYSDREIPLPYSGVKTEKTFDKKKFLEKIQKEININTFKNFQPLILKIKEILDIKD
ncbi:AAA family ATPase [Candidatus Parcubacteria bacterium]|nr:AAA family ATPase [Candidatus Parcubacteria bacterium]